MNFNLKILIFFNQTTGEGLKDGLNYVLNKLNK